MKIQRKISMRTKAIVLFGTFIYLISLDGFASSQSDLVFGLSKCVKIIKDERRLVCFDEFMQNNVTPSDKSSVKVKEGKVAVSQVKEVKAKEAKQIDAFSKQHLKKTKADKGLDSITATIAKTNQLIRGQWVIYFENGQKWQQKDTGRIKLKAGDSIRLKKGSMGAVYLYKEGSHRNIRVKRLK